MTLHYEAKRAIYLYGNRFRFPKSLRVMACISIYMENGIDFSSSQLPDSTKCIYMENNFGFLRIFVLRI